MPPVIARHDGDDALAMSGQVWLCYDAVFGDWESYVPWFEQFFARHAGRDRFRLVVASEDDTVVGFAWGYVGERGQYFTDLVSAALPPELAEVWVGGHFEVVSLGVLAHRRGHGLGGTLLDRLLDGVHRRALLSTVDDADDPAPRLYRRCGWRTLGPLRPGTQLMGREPGDGPGASTPALQWRA